VLLDKYHSSFIQGELEHRRGKRMYKRVSKGKHIIGIGLQVRRERMIHRLQERNKRRLQRLAHAQDDLPTVSFEERETLPPTLPTSHHHISIDTRQKVELPLWLRDNKKDPAIQVSNIGLAFTIHNSDLNLLGFSTTLKEPFAVPPSLSQLRWR
jgi:hypothetical protein